jgi:hypothetical protein
MQQCLKHEDMDKGSFGKGRDGKGMSRTARSRT